MDWENTCPECGEYKQEQYEYCYGCAQEVAYQEGRICECGSYKSKEFKQCYECARVEE